MIMLDSESFMPHVACRIRMIQAPDLQAFRQAKPKSNPYSALTEV
jgi:hypothetical protein